MSRFRPSECRCAANNVNGRRFVNLVRTNLRTRVSPAKLADAAERLTKVERELESLPQLQVGASDAILSLHGCHGAYLPARAEGGRAQGDGHSAHAV